MIKITLPFFAIALFCGCGNKTEEQDAATVQDSTKVDTTLTAETKDTVASAPTDEATAITETLTLIEGHSSEDGGTVTFKTEDGKERLSWTVPEGAVEWNETEVGADIQDKYLNKKYKVTYTMKKTFHDPSQTWETRMDITQMEKL